MNAKSARPTFAELAVDRDNHFNLIRFLAAFAVLFSHGFALSSGTSAAEPLRAWLDTTPGYIAVDVFFVTSGFLVTGSLIQRGSVRQFVLARCLRIYPALAVAVGLTVLVVGLAFTTLPVQAFFSDPRTWEYAVRNITLVTDVVHRLPGAFESTPWKHLVNASLWTLPYEMAMYAILASTWLLIGVTGLARRQWFERCIMGLFALSMVGLVALHGIVSSSLLRLTAMFFCGSTMYILRSHIVHDGRIAILCAVVLAVSTVDPSLFGRVYPLTLPYLVLYAAYARSRGPLAFNRVGDCSYGVYVYAWPVQQMTMALRPGTDAWGLIGISTVVTVGLALASWHLIEKRALALKPRAGAARSGLVHT